MWLGAACLVVAGLPARMRVYRSVLWGSSALLLIYALRSRPGNEVVQYLFRGASDSVRLPSEVFGIAWWVLGAWIVNGVLNLVMRRTLFPHDNQPHARRLFVDLASGLIYVIAFIGIMETVIKQPIGGVLATSGIMAIVLGFALQSTLSDLLSGLALNIDQPFGAGNWIVIPGDVEGQVLQINWRSTRIQTWVHDIVVVPNSLVTKAVVTNHSRGRNDHCSVHRLTVDSSIPPGRVIATIEAALKEEPDSADVGARAYARSAGDCVINYDVKFAIPDFKNLPQIRSDVIVRIAAAFATESIPFGPKATLVRIAATPPAEPNATPDRQP
jgi:small-conductance mechanosensitive channel